MPTPDGMPSAMSLMIADLMNSPHILYSQTMTSTARLSDLTPLDSLERSS